MTGVLTGPHGEKKDELCLQSDPVKELENRIEQLEKDVAQLQRYVIPWQNNGGYG